MRYSGWDNKAVALAQISAAQQPKNKYNAKRVQVDGLWFDSKKEAARYNELKLMRQAGQIWDLQTHPTLEIPSPDYKMVHICKVEFDFCYFDKKSALYVWEDVKSPATNTPLSKLKRKLVEAFYGIKVEVIGL